MAEHNYAHEEFQREVERLKEQQRQEDAARNQPPPPPLPAPATAPVTSDDIRRQLQQYNDNILRGVQKREREQRQRQPPPPAAPSPSQVTVQQIEMTQIGQWMAWRGEAAGDTAAAAAGKAAASPTGVMPGQAAMAGAESAAAGYAFNDVAGGARGGGGGGGGGGAAGGDSGGGYGGGGGAAPQRLARARTPFHDTQRTGTWGAHRFPQAPGRARTPWHSTHRGVDPGGTAAPAPSGTVGRGRGATAAAVVQELRQQGMSDAGIRGILVNIQSESGFKPGMKERNPSGAAKRLGGGHGLYQFTGESPHEWGQYKKWLGKNYPGKDWTDPRLQTRYLAETIKAGRGGIPRKDLWERMKKGSAESAAQAFVGEYLRPRADLKRQRQAQYGRGVPSIDHWTGGANAPAGPAATGGAGGGIGAPGRRARTEEPGGAAPYSGKTLRAHYTEPYHFGPRHGVIDLPGGGSVPFVSGSSRAHPSSPGDHTYAVGAQTWRPKLHGESFPLSNVWDPHIGRTRSALFIHRADRGATLGCIGVPSRHFPRVQSAINANKIQQLEIKENK